MCHFQVNWSRLKCSGQMLKDLFQKITHSSLLNKLEIDTTEKHIQNLQRLKHVQCDQETPFTYKCESSPSRNGCNHSTENTQRILHGTIYLKSGNNCVSLMTFKDHQEREPQLLPSLFHWTDCTDLACNYRAISFPQEHSAACKHPLSLQQFQLVPNYLQYLPTGSLNTFLWRK